MSFVLSSDQQAAVEKFAAFAKDPSRTIFGLLGYAGTGKTTTYGGMAKSMSGQVVLATPTHKATGVVRRKLKAEGVPFAVGFDASNHQPGKMITGTTAQLIGLQPVIAEEQDEKSREFGQVGSGILKRVPGGVKWVVIDEVSMLSADHLALIESQCLQIGAKLLVIGDPGQLPPVNAEPIAWNELPDSAELKQVMRTAGDSMIPLLAQAVRRGEDWSIISGKGIVHQSQPGRAFLDQAEVPALLEENRSVFIAYTNRVVDEVQELACREVYGHGRFQFEPGQLVISESRFEAEQMVYLPKYGRSYPRAAVIANNADELLVRSFEGKGQWGTVVELKRADGEGQPFAAEYLTPEERANKKHPYNVAVSEAMAKARQLQNDWGKDKSNVRLNDARKSAWGTAFDLKDRAVISFRHPFALTSHKSQGSTYREVFVDAQDIERFENGAQSLYVAVTRPSETLVVG